MTSPPGLSSFLCVSLCLDFMFSSVFVFCIENENNDDDSDTDQ